MPGGRAEKARPIDDISLAREDRPQDNRVLRRVVLQIRVLDDENVAGGFANTPSHRRALPEILALQHDPDAVAPVHPGDDLARAIRGPVVDDYQLSFEIREIGRHDTPDDLADRPAFVVDRHDDGQLHRLEISTTIRAVDEVLRFMNSATNIVTQDFVLSGHARQMASRECGTVTASRRATSGTAVAAAERG
jgi:hypothetical protein